MTQSHVTSAEIRRAFLEFFNSKHHEVVQSSPLVPGNDKTLLFTNAGMVQFKDVFLGTDKRNYQRATTSQRCVRAGGKHNDLENVGYTARHHTFFEMLGNFSFGDYFKQDAIHYAWEFLTEVIQLPKEKLWITVFEEDDEAANIWLNDIGVPADRLSRIGAKDNFWQMGDTGPCGPCTEIFYDHGADIWGGPPGTPEEDGDRYIEIWNLVFMQYDRSTDGTLTPLPKPSVDTGMGLERLAAILQGVHSNYEIDIFTRLIEHAAQVTGSDDLSHASLRVIADHIRSCAFMIVDGVLPSNEGRGYVLRRIIRRALRHGHKLGQPKPFFASLLVTLIEVMGDAYPELVENQAQVEAILLKEELRFAETLDQGLKILEAEIAAMPKGSQTIDGNIAFKLYDTYGFPLDLTADIARERELTVDEAGFEAAMEVQRRGSREAGKFDTDYTDKLDVDSETDFAGYEQCDSNAVIQHLFIDNAEVSSVQAGQSARIILDTTPFYGESGGQIGDSGSIHLGEARFLVEDTQKQGKTFIHSGQMQSGCLSVGEHVQAEVDQARRQSIVLNHSATHLMHEALRQVLGSHVEQKGSLVTEQRLRFDFSHFEPMTQEQIDEVEMIVNREIRTNVDTNARLMSMDEALDAGAMALFGEKYDDVVRVMNIGFSTELCGGVHVARTGDIGLFKVSSESGVASGVRRIEAVTGEVALALVKEQGYYLAEASRMLKATPNKLEEKVSALLSSHRKLEKDIQQLKAKLASQTGGDLSTEAVEVAGIKVLARKLDGADSKTLRDTVDQLKNKLGQAAVVLASVDGDKVSVIAGVTKAETHRIKAGDLVNHVAKQLGGKGGGRPDMAQAGGNQPENVDAALASVVAWVEAQQE